MSWSSDSTNGLSTWMAPTTSTMDKFKTLAKAGTMGAAGHHLIADKQF